MKTKIKKQSVTFTDMVFLLAMIPAVIVRKVIVTARLPKGVDQLIIQVNAIIRAMRSSAWFGGATSLLSQVMQKNERLEVAQNLAKTREIGRAAARNAEKRIVLNGVCDLVAFVQNICNDNPESATAICESALFHAKGHGGMPKQVFSAKCIASGMVFLRGSVEYPCFAHEWIMSLTPNDPDSWMETPIPKTFISKTTVTGLTPGERVYFRHRFLTRKGYSEWEQMISIIVS